jgi:hypothetical protein
MNAERLSLGLLGLVAMVEILIANLYKHWE